MSKTRLFLAMFLAFFLMSDITVRAGQFGSPEPVFGRTMLPVGLGYFYQTNKLEPAGDSSKEKDIKIETQLFSFA